MKISLIISFVFCFLNLERAEGSSSRTSTTRPSFEVYVLGTLHNGHLFKDVGFSFADVETFIEEIRPDLICGEMTESALDSNIEGYFPPEQSVVIEASTRLNLRFYPSDWRASFEKYKALTKEGDRKQVEKARNAVDEMIADFFKKIKRSSYFAFISSNEIKAAIKNQHEVSAKLGGEEVDGFWSTRNTKIVQQCLSEAARIRTKKVLFIFGLHHVYALEEILKRDYDIDTTKIDLTWKSKAGGVGSAVLERWRRNYKSLKKTIQSPTASPQTIQMIKQSNRIDDLKKVIESKGVPTLPLPFKI